MTEGITVKKSHTYSPLVRLGHRLKSRSGKKANRSRLGTLAITAVLVLFGLFSALPLLLTVSQAFKPISELFLYPPRFLVENPTLSNFTRLMDIMNSGWVPLPRYLFNSVFITVVGTVGNVFVASLAAYPLAKHQAPGVKLIFSMVTLSLMFSPVINDVANYITISGLGWIDHFASIVVPSFATGFSLFLMRQFMVQIPDAMLEAAKIDGAGEYRILFSIIMPNVRSAWMTLSIFSMQSLWNVMSTPYIYREEMKTLPYAMSQVVAGGIMRTGPGAAASLIILIVPIIFFLFSQSRIMETMVASGIKE